MIGGNFGPNQKELRRVVTENNRFALRQAGTELIGEVPESRPIGDANLVEIPPNEGQGHGPEQQQARANGQRSEELAGARGGEQE